MKKLSCFIFIIFILLSALSCEGPQGIQGPPGEDGDYDKLITLMFPITGGGATVDTAGEILSSGSHILHFNKNNYVNVDSIVFTALIRSYVGGNYCIAELYNVTDSTVIDNSNVTTNSTIDEWIETENIINDLPDHDITLSVRVRTENQGSMVSINRACLYLFRD